MKLKGKELHDKILSVFRSQSKESPKIGIAKETLSRYITTGECGELVEMKLNQYLEEHGTINN